jgi:hypothetical protein
MHRRTIGTIVALSCCVALAGQPAHAQAPANPAPNVFPSSYEELRGSNCLLGGIVGGGAALYSGLPILATAGVVVAGCVVGSLAGPGIAALWRKITQ